ncbi:MAG: hypothetical protein O9254_01425 [Rhodobacteraceae bacterium]|nr:hypothetical protein [Paracoccaceae bacterium]
MAVSAHLRGHSSPINVKNWHRYDTSPGFESTFNMILEVAFRPGLDPRSEHILTRGDVEDIFCRSHAAGIYATMVWGYPRGRFPGGRGFARIFDRAEAIGILLEAARAERLPADRICTMFSSLTDSEGRPIGMGPSTFTKMLYFAGVTAEEGSCLIYDQRVMRAITSDLLQPYDDVWGDTRRLLGQPVRQVPQGRHCASYGPYLRAAEDHGRRHRKTADEVELWLFENAARR